MPVGGPKIPRPSKIVRNGPAEPVSGLTASTRSVAGFGNPVTGVTDPKSTKSEKTANGGAPSITIA